MARCAASKRSRNLIAPGPDGFRAPAMHIEDHPRFAWRGLMMDVSRHFMPVEVVERNLDAMAAVKLNVLHWHLSDDQGFRVESRLHPRLQLMGSDGMYYTQARNPRAWWPMRATAAFAWFPSSISPATRRVGFPDIR